MDAFKPFDKTVFKDCTGLPKSEVIKIYLSKTPLRIKINGDTVSNFYKYMQHMGGYQYMKSEGFSDGEYFYVLKN